MPPVLRGILTILLLTCSNVFMTLAWYGQVFFKSKIERLGLLAVIFLSWLVAFAEYCFMVPANRSGSAEFGGPFSIWSESHSGGCFAYRLHYRRIAYNEEREPEVEPRCRIPVPRPRGLFHFQKIRREHTAFGYPYPQGYGFCIYPS